MEASKDSLALIIAADGNLLFSEESGSGNLSAENSGSGNSFGNSRFTGLKNLNNAIFTRIIIIIAPVDLYINWSSIVAGNILAILVLFAKSTNIFLRQKIALYGISRIRNFKDFADIFQTSTT